MSAKTNTAQIHRKLDKVKEFHCSRFCITIPAPLLVRLTIAKQVVLTLFCILMLSR